MTDDFESYRAFAIDGVGDWTLYDGDQATTLVTPRIPVTYENQGAPMAFQVFNTTETQTWVEDNMDYAAPRRPCADHQVLGQGCHL